MNLPFSSFADAQYDTLFQILGPLADDLTGGALSDAGDKAGDKAAAAAIVLHEVAELFEETAALERQGVSMERIRAVWADAKDIPEAMKLLKDPSLTVVLDGESVTADDDPAEKGE